MASRAEDLDFQLFVDLRWLVVTTDTGDLNQKDGGREGRGKEEQEGREEGREREEGRKGFGRRLRGEMNKTYGVLFCHIM